VLLIVIVQATHAADTPPVHELGSVTPSLVDLRANPAAADLVSVPPVLTVEAKPLGAVSDVLDNIAARVTTSLLAADPCVAGLLGFELVPVVELKPMTGAGSCPRNTIASRIVVSAVFPVPQDMQTVSELVSCRYAHSVTRLPLVT